MGNISKKQIARVAKLSNLKLKASEAKKLGKQLSEIVSYIGVLSKLSLSKEKPTSQTIELVNILREDKVVNKNNLSARDALSGTENTFNNYFVVPSILKKRLS